MKLVYLASASGCSSAVLQGVVDKLKVVCPLYIPCRAFAGSEARMDTAMLETVKGINGLVSLSCGIFVGVYSGHASVGMWRELEAFIQWGKPSCVLNVSQSPMPFRVSLSDVPVFSSEAEVVEWLKEYWDSAKGKPSPTN
jgi:hypothetical protein